MTCADGLVTTVVSKQQATEAGIASQSLQLRLLKRPEKIYFWLRR
jgi:hypothetical protein